MTTESIMKCKKCGHRRSAMVCHTCKLFAEYLRAHFIPFAFHCSCKGAHPDCASVLEAGWARYRRETIEDIEYALNRPQA